MPYPMAVSLPAFHSRPSMTTFSLIIFSKAIMSVVSSQGFTSITTADFRASFFFPLAAFLAAASAAILEISASCSSSSSPKRSKSSSFLAGAAAPEEAAELLKPFCSSAEKDLMWFHHLTTWKNFFSGSDFSAAKVVASS